MLDFSLEKYILLLNALQELEIPIYQVGEWLSNHPPKGIMIRHDIDRFPSRALAMAKCEAERGIKTTYYQRMVPWVYSPIVQQSIHKLGHEVGYHYEALSRKGGNFDKAKLLFQNDLERMRSICPVRTVAMHGSPISKFHNLNFWQHANFSDFNLDGDALMSIDYQKAYYLTDTGRAWNSPFNLRDKVHSRQTPSEYNPTTTDELISFIKAHRSDPIALVIHPERWPETRAGVCTSWFQDKAANHVKMLVSRLRKNQVLNAHSQSK